MMHNRHTWPVLVAIALIPAVAAWWSGRRLAALLDDPVLPERLNAHHRRNGATLGLTCFALAYLQHGSLVWTLPLTTVALMAAGFPLRKCVYGETWSLAVYLWFYARLFVAWTGFWLLLGATPAIAWMAGALDWLVAAALGAALALWNVRFAALLRRCLGTRPLEDGALLSRCRALALRCGLPSTRFERLDLRGGVVANALALPSLQQSSVIFSGTLIERLDAGEVAAICAHELAHLKHHHRERLRRLNAVTNALIAIAVAWAPAARLAGFESILLPMVVWLGILVAALVLRAKGKQEQESACDARAVALTGEPEVLVSALTRLYCIARMPRRLDGQQERSSTHPSLSRRIRDIRRNAGTAAAPVGAAPVFSAADGRAVVTFEDHAVKWREYGAVTSVVSYEQVAELRIDARGQRTPRLVAIAGARRWEMPLAASDVSRAQETLDRIDGRLSDAPQTRRTLPLPLRRVFMALATMLVLLVGQLAVALVTLLALIRPAPQLLLAAGVAALTGTAIAVREYPLEDGLYAAIGMLVGAVGIGVMLLAARSRRDAQAEVPPGRPVFVLALSAALACGALLLNGLDVVRLHQSAVGSTAAPVLLVALASALAVSGVRRTQIAAVASAVAATLVVLAASPAFLDAFARDPLLIDTPPIRFGTVTSDPVTEVDLPSWSQGADVSPDGRHVAVLGWSDGDDSSVTFHVGPAGGTLVPIRATDVTFADDAHLFVLDSDARGTRVRTVSIDEPRKTTWEQNVDDLYGPALSFDPETRNWALTGWTSEHLFSRVTGRMGSSTIERWHARAAGGGAGYIDAVALDGPDALVVHKRYDRGMLDRVFPPYWTWTMLLRAYSQETRYSRQAEGGLVEIGASRVGADCAEEASMPGSLVCTLFDGTRTRLVRLTAKGAVGPVGHFPGRFVSDETNSRGWLTGWAGTPVAIDLASREAFRLPRSSSVTQLSISGTHLVAFGYTGRGPSLRRYALPPH